MEDLIPSSPSTVCKLMSRPLDDRLKAHGAPDCKGMARAFRVQQTCTLKVLKNCLSRHEQAE